MPQECVHLLLQYANDPRPARAGEFDECVRRNLANPWIAGVHNLLEAGTVVPGEFHDHPKYREHRLERWITFRDAFDYANANLAGQTVCLANLDIMLDEQSNWELAGQWAARNIVLC